MRKLIFSIFRRKLPAALSLVRRRRVLFHGGSHAQKNNTQNTKYEIHTGKCIMRCFRTLFDKKKKKKKFMRMDVLTAGFGTNLLQRAVRVESLALSIAVQADVSQLDLLFYVAD